MSCRKCIVDTHLHSDVSGNDSLPDASSPLRQVVVELKDMLLVVVVVVSLYFNSVHIKDHS